MSDIAIKAEGLSKYYKLGVINNGTFFKDVQTWMARKTGKEDPNAKIGSKYDPTAEGFWALKDLNFEIKQGDRVGIIGKNGAGKSTLLKVLSRVTAPTEGDVKIKGRIASLLEVGTGFHPELTGRENIYLNGAILGMKRREVDRKIDEIIAFSEIEKHIDTPVKRYSSGMYVRLAFAVAAHLDSEILIADEVLAVGDAAFQKKSLGKMNELSSGEGRTIFFVSHNMPSVKMLCNKGLLLQKGKLLLDSDIDSVCSEYLLGSNLKNKNVFEAVKIEELKVEIQNIKITENVRSFEPFEVSLKIFSEGEYDNIGLQLMIFDDSQRKLITINPLETENISCVIKKGENNISCTIESFPFCEGVYHLGLAVIQPWVKIYYEEKSVITFTVKKEMTNGRLITNDPVYGLFYTKNTWEFN